MDWLSSWDVGLFRWINREAAGPALDGVMRFLSGNPLFVPALIVVAGLLVWRGGRRGLVCAAVLAIAAAIGNGLVADPLKDWFQRPRPFAVLEDAILRVGRGNPLGSLPSAHSLNMALIATVAGWYYRWTLWILAPVAFAVGYSRIYNGVHFPSDVLAGLTLGTLVGAAVVWALDRAWRAVAPRWWPRAAQWLPSLSRPPVRWTEASAPAPAREER